jgi:hypothetical protein
LSLVCEDKRLVYSNQGVCLLLLLLLLLLLPFAERVTSAFFSS